MKKSRVSELVLYDDLQAKFGLRSFRDSCYNRGGCFCFCSHANDMRGERAREKEREKEREIKEKVLVF